ncbi:MAG: hypothetical protein FJ398_26580 [Verrucomicrobia bacterium]|nr:hypothetical protein [Verrucomicrobiota bacterium]
MSALGQSGPAFDLDWRTAGGVRRNARVGVISFPGGSLECVLTSSPGSMRQDCQSLNQLLLSLRCASLDGKLDLPNVTPE